MTSSESARSANAREEVVGHLDRDVGLEQRRAHVGQGVVDLFGVQLPAGAQLLEGAVEPFGERVEHRASCLGVVVAGRGVRGEALGGD